MNRQKHLIDRLDTILREVDTIKKKPKEILMQYKGRAVTYVRDAAKNDPYYDPEYNQVIVEYVDGEGRETVKEEQLDGWDAEKRQGYQTDDEKRQQEALQRARENVVDPNLTADAQPNMKVQIVDPKQAQEDAKRAQEAKRTETQRVNRR